MNAAPLVPALLRLRRSRRAAAHRLLALVIAAFSILRAAPPELSPGTMIAAVPCLDDPTQSYALFLPSTYSPAQPGPILYCFDPAGIGRRPVERFQHAAEHYGFIVVGSNNARNGPWPRIATAAEAMLRDTRRRLAFDGRRRYAAGFSGGARSASFIAAELRFAGTIGCGGGFSGGEIPAKLPCVWFGTAGRTDFNYRELKQVAATLSARGVPHRLRLFDGGHQWLPEALTEPALAWLELQAMRSGLRPRDEALIAARYEAEMQDAASMTDAAERWAGYVAIAADFKGLADTAEPARRAASLKDSKPVRQALTAEKKAFREEERWIDRLQDAAALARQPSASLALRPKLEPFESPSAASFPSRDERGLGGENSNNFGRPPVWELRDLEAAPADPRSALRDTAADARRKAPKAPAVQRALSAVYASYFENGLARRETGSFAAAIECFEIATLILPDAAPAYLEWARTCGMARDFPQAEQQLQQAIAHGFNDPAQVAQLRQTWSR